METWHGLITPLRSKMSVFADCHAQSREGVPGNPYGWLSTLWSHSGPRNTRCRITLRTPKGTIILTTTHMPGRWLVSLGQAYSETALLETPMEPSASKGAFLQAAVTRSCSSIARDARPLSRYKQSCPRQLCYGTSALADDPCVSVA